MKLTINLEEFGILRETYYDEYHQRLVDPYHNYNMHEIVKLLCKVHECSYISADDKVYVYAEILTLMTNASEYNFNYEEFEEYLGNLFRKCNIYVMTLPLVKINRISIENWCVDCEVKPHIHNDSY